LACLEAWCSGQDCSHHPLEGMWALLTRVVGPASQHKPGIPQLNLLAEVWLCCTLVLVATRGHEGMLI
jgi:hypothetical protein